MRYRFTLPTGKAGVQYRLDTTSGGTTPAAIAATATGLPLIDRSLLWADPGTGALPAVYGPDAVTVLYLKELRYDGTTAATTTLTVAPAPDGDTQLTAAQPVAAADLAGQMIADMRAGTPVFVAHRGCGDEAPEHTLASYLGAVNKGYRAVEVSAQVTADGAAICHHDATWDRATTITGNVADTMWSQIQGSIVDVGAATLGPGWPAQRVPALAEVLAQLGGRVVTWLEPKDASGSSVARILKVVDGFSQPGRSIVWKSYRANDGQPTGHATLARARGLRLWTYLDDADTDSLIDTVGSWTDIIGMPVTATDAKIARAVATGRPVTCWPVRTRKEVNRLLALGVTGFMSTSVGYLQTPHVAQFTRDHFASGAQTGGDYPGNPTFPITYDAATASAQLAVNSTSSMVLGSMSPVASAAGSYTITFDTSWSTLPSDTTQHVDFFFGHADETPFVSQGSANAGGYHTVFRASGAVQLYSHVPASGTSTQLAATTSTAPVAGAWQSFKVTVTPTTVTFERTDVAATTGPIANTAWRGGYIGISAGTSGQPVRFRNVVVINL